VDLLRYSTVVRRMGITKSIERSGEIVRRKKKKNTRRGKIIGAAMIRKKKTRQVGVRV
jgi:hypothetical protein